MPEPKRIRTIVERFALETIERSIPAAEGGIATIGPGEIATFGTAAARWLGTLQVPVSELERLRHAIEEGTTDA